MRRGFTIVELLIVIVVIAILAAITVVAYTGIQNRARATGFTDAIRKVEKAFQLKAVADQRNVYWNESELGGVNPLISTIITNTNLKDYLPAIPEVSGMSGIRWNYDNDGDTYVNNCSTGATGLNIIIYDINQYADVLLDVDKTLDDGNLSCGNFRHVPADAGGDGAVFYHFGNANSSL